MAVEHGDGGAACGGQTLFGGCGCTALHVMTYGPGWASCSCGWGWTGPVREVVRLDYAAAGRQVKAHRGDVRRKVAA